MERKYNQRWNSSESGMTLLELLIAVVILAMIVLPMPASFRGATQIWDKGDRHAEVLQNALIGMEEMTRELRQAKEITAYSPGSITFMEDDDSSSTFVLHEDHLKIDDQPLSGPIDSLTFTLYDQNGDPGTIDGGISAVRIDMNTFDDQNKVNDIPLSSLVYIRKWKERRAGDLFAIYGELGAHLNENVGVTGNVGSNGDITLDNGVGIDGTVVHNGELDSAVEVDHHYGYNLLPCPTTFSVSDEAGDIVIGQNVYDAEDPYVISPGTYGDLNVGNGNAIELDGPGDYYFRSITMGNSISLTFNLEMGGDINLFVVGKVTFGNTLEGSIISSSPGGGPENIYAETHYHSDMSDTDDVAWWMGKQISWLGAIYAPYGHVYMTDGIINGSLYAGGYAIIHQFPGNDSPNNYINYVPSNYMSTMPYDNCD